MNLLAILGAVVLMFVVYKGVVKIIEEKEDKDVKR